jgi:peptidoglycan-associated lipoprotein
MNRRSLALAALFVATLLSACTSRKPAPASPAVPAPAAAELESDAPAAPADATATDLPSDLVELNAEVARRGLLGDVYFEFDQATLDASARERLSRNAEFLRAQPEYVVSIEGHCDERGTNDYNLALGTRRAVAARDFVAALGIAGKRLNALSYGEERPQCGEGTEACWARNRRAHFVITGRTTGN